MKLTADQRAQFNREGYLFFPGQFRPEEVKTLTDAVPELYSRRETLPDDCLVKSYPVDLPWKDGLPASALQTSSVPFDEMKQAA